MPTWYTVVMQSYSGASFSANVEALSENTACSKALAIAEEVKCEEWSVLYVL